MSRSSEDTIPISFSPPMWEQRIIKVKSILSLHKIQEVCDLGCGSGSLLSDLLYFKGMRLLIGVDIDAEPLSEAVDSCMPGIPLYLESRRHPLEVLLIRGSILDLCSQIPFQISAVTLCEV